MSVHGRSGWRVGTYAFFLVLYGVSVGANGVGYKCASYEHIMMRKLYLLQRQ